MRAESVQSYAVGCVVVDEVVETRRKGCMRKIGYGTGSGGARFRLDIWRLGLNASEVDNTVCVLRESKHRSSHVEDTGGEGDDGDDEDSEERSEEPQEGDEVGHGGEDLKKGEKVKKEVIAKKGDPDWRAGHVTCWKRAEVLVVAHDGGDERKSQIESERRMDMAQGWRCCVCQTFCSA
jgi:hypothetical protein